MKKVIAAVLSVLVLTGCSDSSLKPTPDPKLPPSASMTVEEKVGQLFMVHCSALTDEMLETASPGAILMFASDLDSLTKEQVKEKTNSYREKLRYAPYIAVDEEGGTVVRVSSNPNLAPEKYKSPQQYYAEGGLELIKSNAREKSELLLSLGISMNLAPVADISENPDDFIYERTLGMGAAETAEYVGVVTEAMKQSGIASCLKHFPGYGGNIDTHTGVAIDTRSLSHLRKNDFLPFLSGIDAGADAIMVSHNIINDVDPSLPASLSQAVHDMLRTELGFDGLIITDDMAMAAASGYAQPYKKAVLAGNDIIITADFETAFAEVLSAVKTGEIPMEIIDRAADRIIHSKRNHKLL